MLVATCLCYSIAMEQLQADASRSQRQFTTFLLIILAVIGVVSSVAVGYAVYRQKSGSLQARALTIADALSQRDITQLSGADHVSAKLSYHTIKQQLEGIKTHNKDLRFVYLMGKHDNTVFFYVDSEKPGSDGYSAPGEAYPEATPALKNLFTTKKAYVEGPSRDSYGVWFSGLAPATDAKTGKTLAVVGVDIPASAFYSEALLLALLPLLLVAFPVIYLINKRKTLAREAEITRLKSEFISIASHELRSPLSGMLWAIQSLLKSSKVPKSDKHLLEDMYTSTQSSIATINEILDATIFDRTGMAKLRHDIVELKSVLQSVKSTQRLAAEERAITLAFTDKWPEAVYTSGDVAALKRACMNVVSNAIKYSPERTTVSFDYNKRGNVHEITITDHGIGVAAEDIPKVLNGYYRSAEATRMATHGTGIGLYVTRKIIEEQGGSLTISSVVGKGTTVHITLPAAELPAKK